MGQKPVEAEASEPKIAESTEKPRDEPDQLHFAFCDVGMTHAHTRF